MKRSLYTAVMLCSDGTGNLLKMTRIKYLHANQKFNIGSVDLVPCFNERFQTTAPDPSAVCPTVSKSSGENIHMQS
jgi:hypothetical protein